MNKRSIPYITLSWGIYQEQEDPIKFATENLEEITANSSEPLAKITKVYQELETYADQLGAQPVITLPQLTELYALGKTLSDDKIARAVLISLAARHLSFKQGMSHCQKSHIDDAKNIVASAITYFEQEARLDALVYMCNALARKTGDYNFAANQGQKAEAKKLSGNKLFSAHNKQLVDQIRLLLISAHNISLQVEDQQLDDAYILFTVKQELIKQGVNEQLANAITIITGSSYFVEDPNKLPDADHLQQAAEWLVKSEAVINYKANQVAIIKFLQEYFKRNSNLEKSLAAAQAIKNDVLSGISIEGKLKSAGKLAERSWKALLLIQDYAAEYYFSPKFGGFKVNRDNSAGNGFYLAVLTVLQAAFKDDVAHTIHKLTKDNLYQLLKELLPLSKGIIVEHFSNIIRGKANLLSVPKALTEELSLLQSAWLQREHLSATSIEILDRDLNNYLETISSRYIEFINRNPEIGCEIELKILAHYYDIGFEQHSHLIDNLSTINNDANKIAHVLYAPCQAKYYALSHQDLTAVSERSIVDYVKQAVGAVAYIKEPLDFSSLAATVAILAMHKSMVWQANSDIDAALLKQTIEDAYNATKVAFLDSYSKRTEQVFNKTANFKTSISNETKEIKRDLSLSPMPREQLAIIALEASYSISELKWTAAHKAHSNATTAKAHTMSEAMLVALRKKNEAKIALVEERQIVRNSRYNRAIIDHYEAMFLEELRLRNIAKIEAYTAWWQDVIKEQRSSVESAFLEYNKQVDVNIQVLTTAYEQQMTAINKHYDDVTNKTIQAYREYERQVEEEKRKARRKRRRKLIKTFIGMAVAAFVAPVLAQSMFSAGFACTVATGVIAGGISSGIAGNNILKGAAMGGLFAGFGFACDNILGEFIKNNDLLRESLNVAATASLSTAVYGGKVLDNVLASVGANVVASLLIPLPKFNANNKTLTQKELLSFMQRKTARVFTSGMLSSVATKNPNFGMSLMMSGMGALQSWIGHQANMFMLERNVKQQAISTRRHSRPSFNTSNQQAVNHTPSLYSNSRISNSKPLSSSDRGKIGGYKINLPNIELPALNNQFTPNRRSIIFSDPLARYRGVTVSSISDPISSDFHLNFGTRALGLAQAIGGASLATASVAGGIVSLGTGIGPILAAGYATIGADSAIAGAKAFITGEHHHTLLFRGFKGAGLSDNAAMWAELGVNLSFLAPGIARGLGNVAEKNSMLKLYDVTRANKLNWFEPKYVSTGGLRNELPLTAAQKQEALDYAVSLGMPKESITFPETINTSYTKFFGQELLNIGTDVLPSISNKPIANSRVTMRGAIAHEIVGHRAAELANRTHPDLILEEVQASIRAARFAEGLTSVERTTLLRDAIERLRYHTNYKIAEVRDQLWIHEASKPSLTPK